MYLATNNAYSTLAGAISDSATELTVSTGHGDRFPVIADPDYTYCTLEDAGGNIEIIKVTARASASDTMTIERGQMDTTARAWGAGDSIELRFVAKIVEDAIAHYTKDEDAHPASAIGFTPEGNVEADNVQEAIEELDAKKQALSEKDASGGYVGLTGRKLNFINAAGTLIKSFFTNTNTAARTYTFQDRDGTIADDTDLATKADLDGATFTGPINEKMVEVASAAEPDIWDGGNVIDYTGTTKTTGFAEAPAPGARRVLVCAAACTFENNETLMIHGGRDFTAAEGDVIEVIAITTTTFMLIPRKADGTAVVVVDTVPTGAIQGFARSTAPSGWIKANGQTIGNASSGATNRANADTEALFTVLWNDHDNTILPIQTSSGTATTRGVSAAADFAANKRLPVPDYRAEFMRGLDDGRGVDTDRVLGSSQDDEFRSHTHTGAVRLFAPASGNQAASSSPNYIGTQNTGATGGDETRPRNVAALICIKL
jgi:hypothetical protein